MHGLAQKLMATAKKIPNRLEKLDLPELRRSYLYDESKNEYGTIKDRRNRHILNEATRLHIDKLVLITSGNGGYSLARMATGTGIKVVCVVSRQLDQSIKDLLATYAYQVIELNLDQKILRPEELITICRESDEEVIWDVTNGYEEAYVDLVREISQEIVPDYIVCPVGSGGIFVGLVEGVERYSPKTKVIGIGTREAYMSYADKLSTPWSPYTRAIENICARGHQVYRISEEQIRKVYQQFKNYGAFEPSSSVVFASLDLVKFKSTDTVVFVNTGRLRA